MKSKKNFRCVCDTVLFSWSFESSSLEGTDSPGVCVSSSKVQNVRTCVCGFFFINEIGEVEEGGKKWPPERNPGAIEEGRETNNNKIPLGHIDPFRLLSTLFFSCYYLKHFHF